MTMLGVTGTSGLDEIQRTPFQPRAGSGYVNPGRVTSESPRVSRTETMNTLPKHFFRPNPWFRHGAWSNGNVMLSSDVAEVTPRVTDIPGDRTLRPRERIGTG